ncbi:hypothetical protein AB0M95_17290 [Sphaerisporangium sp. NPDC051017]|uniref:hypothetical protein n=1 Tax=Sphaerisporangium sp. NPDC051017 TaxID=3154636 RepID=UPI003448721A
MRAEPGPVLQRVREKGVERLSLTVWPGVHARDEFSWVDIEELRGSRSEEERERVPRGTPTLMKIRSESRLWLLKAEAHALPAGDRWSCVRL